MYKQATFLLENCEMKIAVKTKSECRKEWVTPALKKIDIEEITANIGGTPNTDAGHTGRS